MTARLDQFLEPGEQVVWRLPKCREPNNLYREYAIYVIWVALLFGTGLLDIDPDHRIASFGPFLVMLLIGFAMELRQVRSIEAAITERRVLRVDTNTDEPSCTSMDLVDIASIEVEFRAVHVTKKIGDSMLLELPEQEAKLGRALARTANLAEPRLSGPGEELATHFSTLAGIGGACACLLFFLQGPAKFESGHFPFPLGLLLAILIVVGAVLAWSAGKLLALVVLRLLLSPKDLRNFVRGHAPATIPAAKRNKYRLAWLYSRLFHVISGVPADPGSQGQTGEQG